MQDAVSKYGRKLTVALGDASWESLVTPTLVAAGRSPSMSEPAASSCTTMGLAKPC